MRLRNIKGAKEKLESFDKCFVEERPKSGWKNLFENDAPLHVEFGMGKGGFITGMAKQNPHINYIGVDAKVPIVYKAIRKAGEELPKNLYFLQANVMNAKEYFNDGEIDRLYLNFSDPWPKKRYAKRRLTHRNFIKLYEELLIKEGEIHFKTDNRSLFEFSLNEFAALDLKLSNITLDLHNSEFEGNIMTEYEEKFSKKGQNIYRCEAKFRKL